MELNNLDKYGKLRQVQIYNPRGRERKYTAIYLNAVRKNDTCIVNEFERFGHTIRHMIMNKIEYDRGLLFGFTQVEFNEHGWLDRRDFLEYEEIAFSLPKNKYGNGIQVGKGPNGKWTYGVDISNNTQGHHSGVSVWSDICDTKHEAMESALIQVVAWHTKQNRDISTKIIKMAGDYLKTIQEPKPIFRKQLQLF